MDDKVSLRYHFLRLALGRVIDPSDLSFWPEFWRSPWAASEIFGLKDLQAIRNHNLANFVTLLRCLSEKVVKEAECGVANPKELINSIRLLSKLMPYIYESPLCSGVEYELFGKDSYDPLGVLALRNQDPSTTMIHQFSFGKTFLVALTSLLFKDKFTCDSRLGDLSKVILWEPGLLETYELIGVDYVHLSNRTEILRLLLILCSDSMYTSVPKVISSGSRFLSSLVHDLPRNYFISLVFSLFNFMCKHSKRSQVNVEEEAFCELLTAGLLLAGQLLALMISYPIPSNSQIDEDAKPPHNLTRILFSKLNKNGEIRFVVDNLLDTIRFPLDNSSPNIDATSSSEPSPLCLSSMVILWELCQCNAQIRSLAFDRNLPKLVTALLYHIHAFHDVPLHSHSVKIACYFLLSLSGQRQLAGAFSVLLPVSLISLFPSEFQLQLPVSLREYVVIYSCQVLRAIIPQMAAKTSRISESLRDFLSISLVEVLYNIIPTVGIAAVPAATSSEYSVKISYRYELGLLCCQSIIEVVKLFSSKVYLMGPPRNAELLTILLKAICSVTFKNPELSSVLLYSIIENESTFSAIASIMNHIREEDNMIKYPNNWINECDDLNELEDTKSDKRTLDEQENISSPIFGVGSPLFGSDEANTNGYAASNEPQDILQALLPNAPCGLSTKAKEKLPELASVSISWGGNEALGVINRIIIPNLKVRLGDCWAQRVEHNLDPFYIATQIEHCGFDAVVAHSNKDIPYDFLPETKVDLLTLTWNEVSLGWYMSMLYCDIYKGVDLVRVTMKKNNSVLGYISSSISFFGKFTNSWVGTPPPVNDIKSLQLLEFIKQSICAPNLWRETQIKLFEVQDTTGVFSSLGHRLSDTLASAVNNLTNTLARRLSGMRVNSRSSVVSVGSNMEDIIERAKPLKRPSSSSIHSLNSLNRVRSYTPRNSFGA